ncbi:hypothetical protein L195_g017062 [Trifolium pratense]|uniref:Uncharacterized protein n=1 Tax=Trifolium pratense TaxID=57577 RepID=A0A2K3MSV8_TRIPR|nr:hypothetical protein L195_g017062 [Trifolium pratense]
MWISAGTVGICGDEDKYSPWERGSRQNLPCMHYGAGNGEASLHIPCPVDIPSYVEATITDSQSPFIGHYS